MALGQLPLVREHVDVQEFVRLVAKMRLTQMDYFKRRDPSVLTESVRLEHRVDAALEQLLVQLEDKPHGPDAR